MPSKGERRRGKGYDFEAFRGYRGPRFTPIPDEFLDHQLAHISSAEAKVMLFLFRKTYGYRKSGDHVSLAQLEYGTVSSDGTIIDRGSGLSRATIWRALKGLQEKGLIEVHRQTTPAGDSDVNYYRIREALGPEHRDEADEPGPPSGSPKPRARATRLMRRGGEEGRPATAASRGHSQEGGLTSSHSLEPEEGSSHNETTPSSELNHRPLRSKPPGGFSSEPTRTDSTREDFTLPRHDPRDGNPQTERTRRRTTDEPNGGRSGHSARDEERAESADALYDGLARSFLRSIGYSKPASAKRQRAVQILRDLQEEGNYSLDELQAACEIAASMGARGPELIPHVIGKALVDQPESKVGERLTRQEEEERTRWRSLTAEFDALSQDERKGLLEAARESSDILAQRSPDHPLVRAAAIALLDRG